MEYETKTQDFPSPGRKVNIGTEVGGVKQSSYYRWTDIKETVFNEYKVQLCVSGLLFLVP